ILDWIRQAKISLAGEVGRSVGDISEELVRLKRENNLLRQQLEAFQGKAAPAPTVTNVKTILTEPPVVTQKTAAVAQPAPEPAKPIEKPTPAAPKTYTVRAGDTLSSIARSVYSDTGKWKQIYEANKGTMQSENDLKAGQVLVIPAP
ncbi:MAG: LysM peptidoglycan-binding domain-containing protein, partial [Kiritimatiellales bacterium]